MFLRLKPENRLFASLESRFIWRFKGEGSRKL